MEGKYFWLKLKRDFFKRHDIQIIEGLDNGKDYLLFYLKLLCESVDHEGNLRFSDQIPYNEKMLATITKTNIDIVRSAIEIFTQLGMMEIMDDGTYFMSEVNKMLGSSVQDEHTRESTRLRVQAYRERKKAAQLEDKRYGNATCNGELEKEKEIEIEKEIEKRDKGAYTEAKEAMYTECIQNVYTGKDRLGKDSIDKERIDYQRIADMYNATCVSFPRLTSLSDARKKAIKARLNSYSIDDFKTVFEKAEASDFLKGKNDRNWSANFDWMVKDSNMAKILDGNYDNKKASELPKPAVKQNAFNNIPTTGYDFEELERRLLSTPIGG